MRMKMRFFLIIFAAALTACAVDYVTGERTFNLVSEQEEIQMGKEADPSIVAQYGIYPDEALTKYVDGIGQNIAKVSHRPNIKYTFRVVDSPIVNAFALPGGFVYFTRGILAHFNTEAELAGVMGHEVGHVVARHGAEQMSKAQLAGLGLALGSAVSETFAKYGQLAQAGVGLLFLKFGRGQESESDRLGVEYSTKLGYNAHEMANFFRTIGKLSGPEDDRLPSFLSTHPNPEGREETVHRLANEWQKKIAYKPKNLQKKDYYAKINGIVYGNDPRQGFVENNMFYHPDLRFEFPVPSGWKVVNMPTVVQLAAKDEQAVVQFELAKVNTPNAAASKFITDSKVTVRSRRSATINGLAAEMVESDLVTQEQSISLVSAFIKKDNYVYVFHGMALMANFNAKKAELLSVINGFRQLTNQNALTKKPERIRIKQAPNSGTFSTVMKQMGVADDRISELALINGVEPSASIKKGELVKSISE